MKFLGKVILFVIKTAVILALAAAAIEAISFAMEKHQSKYLVNNEIEV